MTLTKEEETKLTAKEKRALYAFRKSMKIGAVIGIFLLSSFLLSFIPSAISAEPTYKTYVGGYIDMASDTYDPYIIKDNVIKARAGIDKLGLIPSDSSYFWSWEKGYPDGLVSQEYTHMDQIISECNKYISYLESHNGTDSSGKYSDIYMALQNSMIRSTYDMGDIAHDAYIIKYCPTLSPLWSLMVWTLFTTFLLWAGVHIIYICDPYTYRDRE